ncbi:hypothetical protein GCM10009097_22200 [Pigmentiphaga daeguensis]|uniref:Uncharacterized protein n=2 Tax=Pigmentiphaga daeguensis TaxID=414049 RepID=A0ABN1BSN0_9BURK
MSGIETVDGCLDITAAELGALERLAGMGDGDPLGGYYRNAIFSLGLAVEALRNEIAALKGIPERKVPFEAYK